PDRRQLAARRLRGVPPAAHVPAGHPAGVPAGHAACGAAPAPARAAAALRPAVPADARARLPAPPPGLALPATRLSFALLARAAERVHAVGPEVTGHVVAHRLLHLADHAVQVLVVYVDPRVALRIDVQLPAVDGQVGGQPLIDGPGAAAVVLVEVEPAV